MLKGSSERCRKTFDESPNANSCYRETWDKRDRCIWHAKVPDDSRKPIKELRGQRETKSNRQLNRGDKESSSWMGSSEELLDGAQLNSAELDDQFSFENCSLRNANFSDASLEGANFKGAVLGDPSAEQNFGADFSGTNLNNADFSKSNLRGANFSEANLKNANLTHLDADTRSSDQKPSKFLDSKLTDADLSYSDFRGAEFSQANFSSDVISRTAVWGPGVHPSNDDNDDPDLEHACFMAADFMEANLKGLEISESDFDGADLSDACLLGATLLDVTMDYVILSNADARDADLSGSSLKEADLTETALEGTNLSDVDLQGTILDHVSLGDNQLKGIKINEETSFAPPSRWELRADADAETGCFGRFGMRRLRAFNRSASDSEDLQSAEIQYRLIQRLQREHDLVPNFTVAVYEKHAMRKRSLAEKNFAQWVNRAFSRWVLGYGLRIRPVIGTMLGIILIFGLLYPVFGFLEGTIIQSPQTVQYDSFPPSLIRQTGIDFLHGLYLSAITFSTLGYGDVSPTGSARILATIESFIGGLLMAYLVFVLGRRISR